jgi:hypothetical protein
MQTDTWIALEGAEPHYHNDTPAQTGFSSVKVPVKVLAFTCSVMAKLEGSSDAHTQYVYN